MIAKNVKMDSPLIIGPKKIHHFALVSCKPYALSTAHALILTVTMLIHRIEALVVVKHNNVSPIHIAFYLLFFHKLVFVANKNS